MKRRIALTLLTIMVLSLLILSCTREATDTTAKAPESVLDKVKRERVIHVGFAGYPPYLERDPNTGEVSGYSVDLIKYIADELKAEIKWHETTWDTMKPDIILGKFDVMTEPIFRTIPRAAEVDFTRPYAYFGYACWIVRKSETRFKSIEELNNPDVTIAVTQGVASHEYAKRHLPKAQLKVLKVADPIQTFMEVVAGKVDVALGDVPTVVRFIKAHPEDVEGRFVDNPPAIVPAGFMVRQGDVKWVRFLDTCLDYMEATGILDALEKKYELLSFREKKQWVSGRGLE